MNYLVQHLGMLMCGFAFCGLVGAVATASAAGKGSVGSAMGTFTLTVSGSGSLSFGGSSDLIMTNLAPGYAYRLDPGPYASSTKLTPIVTGAEVTTPIEMSFTNDGSLPENLVVTLDLPEQLRNNQGMATPCFFPDDALYCVETEQRFNPNRTVELQLDRSQTRTLDLGIVVSIPRAASTDDTFTGTVRTLVHVTGL